MVAELLTLANELHGLSESVELGYDGQNLDQVSACLDEIRAKALQVEAIVDSDEETKSRSGAQAWLTARSAEDLLEQSSKVQVDWDTIGACVSFLQSGIGQLTESLTQAS